MLFLFKGDSGVDPAFAGASYRIAILGAYSLLSRFRLPGPEMTFTQASGGQGRVVSEGTVPRVGLIVTNLGYPPQKV